MAKRFFLVLSLACWIIPVAWGMRAESKAAASIDLSAEKQVCIDLGKLGFPKEANVIFAENGFMTDVAARKIEFLAQCSVSLKMNLEGGEIINKSGKVVATAGLRILTGDESPNDPEYLSKINPSRRSRFTEGQSAVMVFCVFKEDGDIFVPKEKLPEEWATEDSGELTCRMIVTFVADK